jgi:hypothetical protein
MSNQSDEITLNQIKKMRRRIEEFLRSTTPDSLIKIADICGVHVPKNLRDRYEKQADAYSE